MNTMNTRWSAALTAAFLLAGIDAAATTLTFDDLALGTKLSTQYAGVVFAPNAFPGTSSPSGAWATNTDMTIVSASGGDVGALGAPSLVSGNVLRSFAAWLDENGEPSFRVSFVTAIDSFSADFAGVSTPADVRLFLYNGNTLLSTVTGSSTGQFTLAYAAPRITSVIVTPGDSLDYVAVDNIRYQAAVTAIPEPSTWEMAALGAFVLTWASRRKVPGQTNAKPAPA